MLPTPCNVAVPAPDGAQSLQELRLPGGAVRLEILSRPYSHSTYQNILRSKPEKLPESLTLTNRRRIAFEGALAHAFSQPDPVRQLVVFVRVYALRMTAPEYAHEIGLKAHSYTQLEARGFDPRRSVASSFGCFLRDWERRAQAHPESAVFFRWAQHRLEQLLVGQELGTPRGFFLKCQNRVGSRAFAEATGLTPKILSDYRTFNKNIPFSEMLGVIDALSGPIRPARDGVHWDSPLVVDARRIFFHHSLQLGRPASAAKVHMLLVWVNLPCIGPDLHREVPTITDREAGKIARFEPVSAEMWAKIQRLECVVDRVPKRFLEGVTETIEREARTRSAADPSVALAVQLMRSQRLSTKVIARVSGLHDSGQIREGTDAVRNAIFHKAASARLTWGPIAAVISRDIKEFQQMISLREQELAHEYLRRSGHKIGTEALAKKIWGGDTRAEKIGEVNKQRVLDNRTHEALIRFSRPFFLGVPSATIRAMGEARGLLPIWRSAQSGPDRLASIVSGEVIPTYPEYERYLRAGRVIPNDAHAIGWRHAFGAKVLAQGGGTAFGVVQRRVLKTLLYEESESRGEALAKRELNRLAAAQWFQALDSKGEVPLVVVKRLVGFLGVPSGSPRHRAIESILSTKSYSTAIREWLKRDMEGLTSAEKRDVLHLMQVGPRIRPENIFTVDQPEVDLLAVVHGFKGGSIATMPLSWKRTVRGVHSILKMFPGATLDDVRDVFAEDGKIVRMFSDETSIPSTWDPQFENYADKALKERGILDKDYRPARIIPIGVQGGRASLHDVIGHDSDRGSLLKVLFPPDRDALRGESRALVVALRHLIMHGAGAINLDAVQKNQLIQAFKESLAVSPSLEECRRKVGSSLAGLGGKNRGANLDVYQALDRFLTFLAFGD
jgi:hypothetical protein